MEIEKVQKLYFYPNETNGRGGKDDTTSLPLTDHSPKDLISDGATLECKLIKYRGRGNRIHKRIF